jgi:hypothetical protein
MTPDAKALDNVLNPTALRVAIDKQLTKVVPATPLTGDRRR